MEREERREADELQMLRDQVQRRLAVAAAAERPSDTVIASAELLANISQTDLHERLFKSSYEQRALQAIRQRQRLNPVGPSPNSCIAHGAGRKEPRIRTPFYSPQLEQVSAKVSASAAVASGDEPVVAPASLQQPITDDLASAPLTSQPHASDSCSDAAPDFEEESWGVTPMGLAQAAATHLHTPNPAHPPSSPLSHTRAVTQIETSIIDAVPSAPVAARTSNGGSPASAPLIQPSLARAMDAADHQGTFAPSASFELKGTSSIKESSKPKRNKRHADDDEWNGETEQKGLEHDTSGGSCALHG